AARPASPVEVAADFGADARGGLEEDRAAQPPGAAEVGAALDAQPDRPERDGVPLALPERLEGEVALAGGGGRGTGEGGGGGVLVPCRGDGSQEAEQEQAASQCVEALSRDTRLSLGRRAEGGQGKERHHRTSHATPGLESGDREGRLLLGKRTVKPGI